MCCEVSRDTDGITNRNETKRKKNKAPPCETVCVSEEAIIYEVLFGNDLHMGKHTHSSDCHTVTAVTTGPHSCTENPEFRGGLYWKGQRRSCCKRKHPVLQFCLVTALQRALEAKDIAHKRHNAEVPVLESKLQSAAAASPPAPAPDCCYRDLPHGNLGRYAAENKHVVSALRSLHSSSALKP